MTRFVSHLPSPLTAAAKSVLRRRLLDGRFRSTTARYAPSTGEEVPVFLCLWNRPSRLIEVLRMLDAQTGTPGIDLYLWNNAKVDHEHYSSVLEAFRATGAVHSVHLTRSPYNLGSMGRYYPARAVAKARGAGPMIVIDDDEDFTSEFVATALAAYSPHSLSAYWAFTVHSKQYWDRSQAFGTDRVDHIGPGGMVCDRSLFLDPEFFSGLSQEHWLMDDLWLTYYARTRGLTLAALPVQIEFVHDETNQYRSLIDHKQAFFEHLYGRLP